jgi:hypothetical protein
MMDNSLFIKWNEWLSTICADVQGLLINRHIYQEVQQIIQSNAKIQVGSSFYDWMVTVYVIAMAMGVRRQLDTRSDSISFARLLGEILKHPEVLSRERYSALYEGSGISDKVVHRRFEKFSQPGHAHVDPGPVGVDLASLQQTGERIRKFATKRIAHFDKAEFRDLPTHAELDRCLDYLEEILKKYLALFRAERRSRIVPVWQYDWKEVFRRPWIE